MKLTVETSQTIARPAAEVFDAWLDPKKMAGYFITSGSGPMEAGKTVTWRWADFGDFRAEIDVRAVEPHRRLEFQWSAGGDPSTVTADFEEQPDGSTKVTVREGEWESDDQGVARYGNQMQGWVNMLCCLKAYLEYEQINLRNLPVGTFEMTVERSMKASPEALFCAWTREWSRWFAYPRDSVRMQYDSDLAFTFDGATEEEGKRYPHYGRFVRVEENRLVELTWVNECTHGAETRVVVELTPKGEAAGTHLKLSHRDFPDQASRDGYERNWPEVLAHLDRYLTE